MKKRVMMCLAALVLSFTYSNAAFSSDSELRESSKCGRYFSGYENRYDMPENLVRAISTAESGKWSKAHNRSIPWPWTVNARGKGYHFPNKLAAVAAVRKMQQDGIKLIDVGCMQINLHYHPDAFVSLEQAFEPTYNIAYAAKFLNGHYQKTRNWKRAVSHYHSKTQSKGSRYLKHVMMHLDTINDRSYPADKLSRAHETLPLLKLAQLFTIGDDRPLID